VKKAKKSPPLRILLAITQALLLQDLTKAMENEEEVTGLRLPRGRSLRQSIADLAPDVVLYQPPETESDPIQRIVEVLDPSNPAKIVLIATRWTNRCNADRARKSGVSGFLFASSSPSEYIIPAAKNAAAGNGDYQAPAVPISKSPSRRRTEPTQRQAQVWSCVHNEGMTTKEAAAKLGISSRTAEKHRAAAAKFYAPIVPNSNPNMGKPFAAIHADQRDN
jgi:DNA-binding NarL/FixJ family response regulator